MQYCTMFQDESPCCSGRGDDLEEVECGFDGCQTQGLENQACLPIPVPRNDTEFGRQPCMMFVRSLEVPNIECQFGEWHFTFIEHDNIVGSFKKMY